MSGSGENRTRVSADDVCVTTTDASLSPIVELRQYTLHSGMRDTLIELFDRALIESQEAAGMRVIGQFRDVDDPDRFVWLRGFPDMTTRATALESFYGGPVWKANRDVANATMIDSDNVLLLRRARHGSGFSPDLGTRRPRDAGAAGPGFVIATIYPMDASALSEVVDYFDRTIAPALTESGAAILGVFVTEPSANTFPALPIRENENVFVWLAGVGDATRVDVEATDGGAPGVTAAPQRLRLTPTARSLLTGRSRSCPAMPTSQSRHA